MMDTCRQAPPPLYQPDPARAAACFVYRDTGPELPLDRLAEVMNATTANRPS